MTNSFDTLTGDVLVSNGPTLEEADNPDDLYRFVVFDSSEASIVFSLNMGMQQLRVTKNENFGDESDSVVFYPPYNEVVASPYCEHRNDLEVFHENAELKYRVLDGEIYIKSQNVFSYFNMHFSTNGNIYRRVPWRKEQSSFSDDFLQFGRDLDEVVIVQNVGTNVTIPVERDRYDALIESEETNGVLKLREQRKSMKNKITQSLSK